MKLYSYKAVDKLIQDYSKDGEVEIAEIVPGCLGYGFCFIRAYGGAVVAVVKEHYLNEWSSAHTIRQYRKLPKKYQAVLDAYDSGIEFFDPETGEIKNTNLLVGVY